MIIRHDFFSLLQVFHKIVETFKRHGAETIDTPVFELKEVTASPLLLFNSIIFYYIHT